MCEEMYSTFNSPVSIYCEELDGECFEFHKCMKCKYKKAEMIDERNCERIAQDARLAIDALQGLVNCSPHIHQDYLKEKLSIARRCIAFMEHFEKE